MERKTDFAGALHIFFSYDMMENRAIAYRLENRNHEKSGITKNKEKTKRADRKIKQEKEKETE